MPALRFAISRSGMAVLAAAAVLLAPVSVAAAAEGALARDADLYLVPIGAFPEEVLSELAHYYREQLGLSVEVTGPLPHDAAAVDESRRQLVAQELTGLLARGFRGWVRNPRALFVAITQHDLYIRDLGLRFAFSYRRGSRYAVVSAARMRGPGEPPWSPVRVERLRKMVTKTVALQLLGLQPSSDPKSVLYGQVYGLIDLDIIDEASVERDVLPAASFLRPAGVPGEGGVPGEAGVFEEAARGDSEPAPRERGHLDRYGVVYGIVGFAVLAAGAGVLHARRTRRVWREVALRRGWRLLPPSGPWWNRGAYRIELEIDGRPVVVDWFRVQQYRSSMTFTRIRADVPTPHHFRIAQHSLFHTLGKLFGSQDVEVGDPAYDSHFVIQSDAPEWLRDRLPPHLRQRHLRTPVAILVGDGALETRHLGIAQDEEQLLSQLQIAADCIAFLRDRPRTHVALDAAQDELPEAASGAAAGRPDRSRRRIVGRFVLALFGLYFVGSAYFTFWIQTEKTNEPWLIGFRVLVPVSAAILLAVLIRYGRRLREDFARYALAFVVAPPVLFLFAWGLSGPWVNAWNALIGEQRQVALLGPALEIRSRKGQSGPTYEVTVSDPETERRVRLQVDRGFYERVRPGDPVRFDLTKGSLGIFYWLKWEASWPFRSSPGAALPAPQTGP